MPTRRKSVPNYVRFRGALYKRAYYGKPPWVDAPVGTRYNPEPLPDYPESEGEPEPLSEEEYQRYVDQEAELHYNAQQDEERLEEVIREDVLNYFENIGLPYDQEDVEEAFLEAWEAAHGS